MKLNRSFQKLSNPYTESIKRTLSSTYKPKYDLLRTIPTLSNTEEKNQGLTLITLNRMHTY